MTKLRPTLHAAALLLLGVAIWYAAVSQGNNGAFIFGFLVAGVALLSAARTRVNVRRLRAFAECPQPVFAGDDVRVPVEIANSSRQWSAGVAVAFVGQRGRALEIGEIPAGDARRVKLRFQTEKRGEHQLPSLRVASRYPFGFFKAWREFPAGQRVLVYPRPEGNSAWPVRTAADEEALLPERTHEGDDFDGLRPYVPGESQRHVDWKAVARGAPLMIKRFADESGGRLVLDWDAAGSGDDEARLSQLALWVLRATRQGRRFSLRLPGQPAMSGTGEAHASRCLRALAHFGEGEPG